MKQVTNSLRNQRKLLFGKDGNIKLLNSLTVNWKIFLVTKLIQHFSDKINRAICKLVNTNKILKRKFYEVEINLQEEKRIAKRKRDNAYKDEIEKRQRLMKSCHEVLKIIALSVNKEGLENLLTEETFGSIEVQQSLSQASVPHKGTRTFERK